jgi:phosphatidylserine/phosphatidylglycerophosphate/cardiolipin synthase-like enzyme
MIVDRTIVITGSYNFTKAAEEKNAENLLIITSADMAKLYLENWTDHKEHLEAYQGRY